MGFHEDIDDLNRTQRLLSQGLPGSARIAALRGPLGNEDEPTVEFELQVRVDGAAAYSVTHRQAVPRPALSDFVLGATVDVRVDPGDPHALLIT